MDEAHRLKNPTSKLFEQLSSIPHKHCVLLTGTPLQNRTEVSKLISTSNPPPSLHRSLAELKCSNCKQWYIMKETNNVFSVCSTGQELWALLHFADSERFSDLQEFLSQFGDLKDSGHVAQLHGVLKPYLLRRIKEDVEKSLPPKEETIIEVS